METIAVAAVAGVVIMGLFIKAALLDARLEGYREAERNMSSGQYNNPGLGCLGVLAVIGLLAVCTVIFYVGMNVSAWAR